jgi:hypothetical protein
MHHKLLLAAPKFDSKLKAHFFITFVLFGIGIQASVSKRTLQIYGRNPLPMEKTKIF